MAQAKEQETQTNPVEQPAATPPATPLTPTSKYKENVDKFNVVTGGYKPQQNTEKFQGIEMPKGINGEVAQPLQLRQPNIELKPSVNKPQLTTKPISTGPSEATTTEVKRNMVEQEAEQRFGLSEKDKKKRKWANVIASLGDGVASIAKLYYASKGAKFGDTPSITKAVNDRFKEFDTEAARRKLDYINQHMSAWDADLKRKREDEQEERRLKNNLDIANINANASMFNALTRANASESTAETRADALVRAAEIKADASKYTKRTDSKGNTNYFRDGKEYIRRETRTVDKYGNVTGVEIEYVPKSNK